MSGTLKLDAGLLGAASAALLSFKQDNDDRDQRLMQARQDNRDTNIRLNEILSSGDWRRLLAASVRDALIGIAAATPTTQPVNAVPPVAGAATRPDLSSGANVPAMAWPPQVGNYDSAGLTSEVGELGLAFSVMTYQEPRVWNQGLTQSRPPTPQALMQLFSSAAALSAAIMAQNLTPAEWAERWLSLFGSGTIPAPSGLDPHQNPLSPPRAQSVHALVQSVVPQPSAASGPTTDQTQRWAMTVSAGTIPIGQTLFSVTFNAPYRYRDAGGNVLPFVPMILPLDPASYGIAAVTSSGFSVVANAALTAVGAATVSVNVMVVAGVPTVL